jgi:hypothetical protein
VRQASPRVLARVAVAAPEPERRAWRRAPAAAVAQESKALLARRVVPERARQEPEREPVPERPPAGGPKASASPEQAQVVVPAARARQEPPAAPGVRARGAAVEEAAARL